jgi:plastocyanin
MDYKKIIIPIITIFLIGSAITLAQTITQPLPRQSLIETKWPVDAKKQGNIKQGGAVGDGGLVAYRNSIELNIPLKKGSATNLNQEGNDDSTSVAQRGIEKKDIRRGMVISSGSQTKREFPGNSTSTDSSTDMGYLKAKLQIVNIEGEDDYIIGIISKEGLSVDSISNLKLPSKEYFRELFKSGENIVFLSFDQQSKNLKKIREGGYIPGAGIVSARSTQPPGPVIPGAGIVSARLAFIVIDDDLQKIFSDPEWWEQNKEWFENEVLAKRLRVFVIGKYSGNYNKQEETPASCYKERVNSLNREMQSRKKQALSEYRSALKSATSATAKREARKTYNNKIKEINNWYNQQLNQSKIDCSLKRATTTESMPLKTATITEPLLFKKATITELMPTELQKPTAPIISKSSNIESKVEADDYGFYPSFIEVNKGSTVILTFVVRDKNVYYGGLDFRSDKFKIDPVKPGQTTTVKFIADQDFVVSSYWPLSNAKKADFKIIVK